MATVDTSQQNLDYQQSQADAISKSLQNSPTAYADGVPATSSDIALGAKLTGLNKTIDTIKSNQLRNQWYGPQSNSTTTQTGTQADQVPSSNPNWIVSGLSALQKPLNAITGAEQWALGKGSKSDLFGNINDAMSKGLTAGDVLKQYGVPRGVQIPLGFMLDVFQDPINWITAGSEALIPRVGMGLVKGAEEGGIEGGLAAAKEGLVSGLARKVSKVLPYNRDWLTGAAKVATEGEPVVAGLADKFSDAYKGFINNVGSKAISSSDAYDALTGTNVYDKLGKNLLGGTFKVGDAIDAGVRSLPHGDAIADAFKYSVPNQVKVEQVKDIVKQVSDKVGVVMSHENGQDVVQDISTILKPGSGTNLVKQITNRTQSIIGAADTVGTTKVADTLDNAQKLLAYAGEDASLKNLLNYNPEDLVKAYKVQLPGTTGVGWYDDIMSRGKGLKMPDPVSADGKAIFGADGKKILGETLVKPITMAEVLDKMGAGTLAKSMGIYDKVQDWTPFTKILKANDTMLSLFKVFKVPASLSAHFYAWSGNMTMGWMLGLPVDDLRFAGSVMQAHKFLSGNQDALWIRNNFFNEINSMADFMENHPNQFRQALGFGPGAVGDQITADSKILGSISGPGKTSQFTQAAQVLKQGWDRTDAGHDALIQLLQKVDKTPEDLKNITEINAARQGMPSSIETVQKMTGAAKGAPITASELPSGWGVNETLNNNLMNQWKLNIADGAQSATNPMSQLYYKTANVIMNKLPNMYEKIDQSYKLGTVRYLSLIGVPEENLLKIAAQVPITKSDIVKEVIKAGQKRYLLTPQKASEVAMEAFMNYGAMPDFVKVMRALPIVGSPFLSFSYATAAKAGKTLVNNPSFFNKVAFLINEISGARTPQEKEAMTQKYNQYLNSPTVVNIGHMFGTDVNTDVKTVLPYLTMNMLNSSQKNYDNSFPSQVVEAIDASPFMKHPIGQMLFDYVIQPSILAGTNQVPEMQFGEPLYPSYDVNGNQINPSLGTKAFYAGRQAAETLLPGVASYAGLLGSMLPQDVINAIPSFGFRQVANAVNAKNTLGATTAENPLQKTLRALSGRSGLPLYPLNSTTVKKPAGQ
jgi:hypothetical protein